MDRGEKLIVKGVFDHLKEKIEKNTQKTTYGKKELIQFLDQVLIEYLLD